MNRNKAFRHVVQTCMLLATVSFIDARTTAMAQVEQTGQASPGRVEEQFKDPEFVPEVSPRVEVKELELDGAPANADEITFKLTGINLEGVTVYDLAALRAVYEDRIGTVITLAELYDIAADLTRKYRNDGYILTRVVVPPQVIEETVRLQVVEGYIDQVQVRFAGEEKGDGNMIRDYASSINTGGPLNAKDMERALLLINDLPGISARSILSPSQTQAGAADLLIIIERKKYNAEIGVNNYGTRFLGPVQTHANGALNSYFGNNERISAQVVMAHDDDEFKELFYGSLSYDQPIGKHGTKINLFTSYAETEPGYTLDQFDVEGISQNYAVTVSHPFIRSRNVNLEGYITFDFLDLKSQDNLGGPTIKDHIRAARFGGEYEYLDTLLGLAFNTISIELSQGLKIFGANSSSDENVTRPAADPQFFKAEMEIQRLQRITNTVNLLLAAKGQWSANPLYSSEEFGLGGINYGRGYDASEVIGDEGIAGKIEVQWREPYALSFFETYQLYGFYDAGRIWNDDSAIPLKKETLTSTGFGIRAYLPQDFNAGLMVAFPLNKSPQTQGDKDPRFFFSLTKSF